MWTSSKYGPGSWKEVGGRMDGGRVDFAAVWLAAVHPQRPRFHHSAWEQAGAVVFEH